MRTVTETDLDNTTSAKALVLYAKFTQGNSVGNCNSPDVRDGGRGVLGLVIARVGL